MALCDRSASDAATQATPTAGANALPLDRKDNLPYHDGMAPLLQAPPRPSLGMPDWRDLIAQIQDDESIEARRPDFPWSKSPDVRRLQRKCLLIGELQRARPADCAWIDAQNARYKALGDCFDVAVTQDAPEPAKDSPAAILAALRGKVGEWGAAPQLAKDLGWAVGDTIAWCEACRDLEHNGKAGRHRRYRYRYRARVAPINERQPDDTTDDAMFFGDSW